MKIITTQLQKLLSHSGLLARLFASAVLATALLSAQPVLADSVGQQQTTKYFTPDTVKMLIDRIQSGGAPGFATGDFVSYIIQFTPVGNGSDIGAGGWITDYIPAGAKVVGAWFVQPNGLGDFTIIAPPSTAQMPAGWGNTGGATFNANWTTTDPTAVAACGGNLTNCWGWLSELYADTGIFYSTDPRTAVNTYPSVDGRVRAAVPAGSGNGYHIKPLTGANSADPLIAMMGGTSGNWTVHNYWDAANINAFASLSSLLPPLPAAPSATNLPIDNVGTGPAPFNAGSPVAGPDTGYQLDYTGGVGPWQRIYYPGSTAGKNTNGKATVAGANVAGGTPTGTGWNLGTYSGINYTSGVGWNIAPNSTNALPVNTNAVRWAAGRISVGTLSYVKVTLQLTQTPPAVGLINNSEVFGGDASTEGGSGGRDQPWKYTVPSVADNNSNLFVLKEVIGICSSVTLATAQTCDPTTATNGVIIPAQFVKLRYRLTYLNSGNASQTNVQLSDILPFNTAAASPDLAINAGNLYVKSGPDIRNTTPGLTWNAAAAGATRVAGSAVTALNTAAQQTIAFSQIASLPAGTGGVVEMDVVLGSTAAAALGTGALVSNMAQLSSTQLSSPAISIAGSSSTNVANLVASKTTATPSVAPGGAATYTITITNNGNANASTLVVNDFLPSDGGALTAHGFTTTAGTIVQTIKINGVTQAGGNNPTATYVTPAIIAPYTGMNQQQVTWTFPAALTIPVGQSMTILFSTTVGASVAASALPYTNDVVLTYNSAGGGGAANASASVNNTAPVAVSIPLTVTKTLNCVYSGAICNAYTGGPVPSNAKLRYQIHYQNTSAGALTNVQICDQMVSTAATQFAGSSITSPVTIAPTPVGAYTDTASPNGPGAAATSTANGVTVCGNLTSATGGAARNITFSYPAIASLAAGASGDVYVDVATGTAANNTTVTNTGNVVSTGYPGGTGSIVSTSVRDNANLVVTKTAVASSINYNSPASYILTITNSGNQNATNIKVYDELPYTGTVASATTRFNYTATGAITGLTSVVPTSVVPPTLGGYTSNANQNEVLWNFGVQTLAPGGVLTIPFTATPGTALNPGSTIYTNDAQVSYTSGTSTLYSGTTLQAPVTIPVDLSITKTIDCVYVAGVCTSGSFVAGSGIPAGAKVRYRIVYQNISTSARTNVLVSDALPTQTAIGSVSNVVVVSGSAIGTTTPALAAIPAGTGATSFSFANIASLAAGAGGTVTFDVQTNAAVAAIVTNTGKIVATQNPTGVTSSVTETVPINFSITKTISCVYVAGICTPGSYVAGAGLPVNAKIEYKIVYQNIGPFAMSNMVLSDTLPTQTAAASVSNVVGTGSSLGTTTTPALASITAGGTFSFTTIASLAAGAGGTVTFDVQTNAAAAATVTNTGKIVSTEDITGVSSSVADNVTQMVVTKIISCVYSGLTCTPLSYVAGSPIPPNAKIKYQLTYSNPGGAVANVYICDQLPTQVAAFTSVTNFTSSAGLAAPTSPANATCGFAAPPPLNFSYAVIASLAAAAPAATVTYDVQTTAAIGNTLTNTGKLASATQNTSSVVSASVLLPNLLITKTASPTTAAPGGTVTYTITVTNNGNSATTALQIYDLLPYSGAVLDATKNFAFDGTFTPTFVYGGGAPTPGSVTRTLANPPTLTGYTTNLNQNQVLWDFGAGAYALPVNGTITITFRATVGSAMPVASYYNTVYGAFNSYAGPGTASVITALVSVATPTPSLTFLKTVNIYWDPVNLLVNPKFIPGAQALYTLIATNSGTGPVDSNTLVITDPVPANTALYVSDLGVVGSGPVAFSQGATTSGLTYTFTALGNMADDVSFSTDGGVTWTAVPVPGADGCDPTINAIRINPKLAFAGSPTAPSPSFQLLFRVCVK